MADNNTIARPYARAAFELANALGDLDKWSKTLGAAALLVEDGQAAKFLHIPALTAEKRTQFVEGLLGALDKLIIYCSITKMSLREYLTFEQ